MTIKSLFKTTLLSIFSATVLWPFSANAQLEEVLVTAQKRDQSLQDVPISVDVLSEDALSRAQFSDMRELTQLSPSINFQEGYMPSASTFSIRGIGSYAFTGGIQPSVGVVLDGVPLARAGEFVMDMADVAQIEVLRGPQGTLFGANATGGVINVKTKQPTDEFEGEIEAGLSTDDEILTRVMVSGPLSDRVRGRLVAVMIDRDGHIKNYGGEDAGGVENLSLWGKLNIDLSDRTELQLAFDHSDREHGFHPQIADIGEVLRGIGDVTGEARKFALGNGDPVLGQKILDDPFATNTSKDAASNETDLWGLSATLNIEFSDSLSLKSITSYRDSSDQNNPDVDETPADGNNLSMPIVSIFTDIGPNHLGVSGIPKHARGNTSEYFTQEFNLVGKSDAVDWLIGAYYRDWEEKYLNNTALLIVDSFNPAFGGGAAVGGTATPNDEYVLKNDHLINRLAIESIGIFADATWHVSERLDLFAGVRWTQEDLDSDIDNRIQLVPFTFAEIAERFDESTMTLAVSDLPVFPYTFGATNATGASGTDDSFVSYRAGASFSMTDDVTVYASASRGYVGIGKNMSYSSTLETFLAPTEAESIEIGLKADLADNRLRLSMAAFWQDVEDLQASALIPGTVTTETINAGGADITGIEADAVFFINENIALSAGIVYLDAELKGLQQPCFIDQLLVGSGCTVDLNGDGVPETQDLAGKAPPNTPELKFNLGLSFTIPTNNMGFDFFGNLNYSYQDDTAYGLSQDDLAAQDSYGILDLTVGIVDKEGRYEVQLYGKNITDEFYVADAFEAFGALGRRVIRVNRNATDYWGIRFKYNF